VKKVIALLLIVTMVAGMFTFPVSAATEWQYADLAYEASVIPNTTSIWRMPKIM